MNAFEYAEAHYNDFLEELKAFLRIPSISALTKTHSHHVQRTAEWVAEQLRTIGMATVGIYKTPGHPVVVGSWTGAPGAPTILVYGHYDVQPADRQEDPEWKTDPFEPVIKDGDIYARGSSDDKGQVLINMKAAQSLIEQYGGKLPFNIKFLIEGEEEVTSTNLDAFIASHKDLLRADVAIISDSHILSIEQPSIVYGVRGIIYVELEVHGPARDLHSGGYGGTVHNPLQAICEIIAALHNPDGSVAVKGFYDSVIPLSATEREALAKVPYPEAEWLAETGAPRPWGEEGYTLRERIGGRPTLEINGIWGGWMGEGSKTVLPAKVTAKISCRLVPNQEPLAVEDLLRAHIKSITPPDVTAEVRRLSYGDGAMVPIDSPAMRVAEDAYEHGFGKKPVFLREGGSIPVVATLQKVFGVPVIMAGYGLPDDSLHGPNEKLNLECFRRGIVTSIALFEGLGKLKSQT